MMIQKALQVHDLCGIFRVSSPGGMIRSVGIDVVIRPSRCKILA